MSGTHLSAATEPMVALAAEHGLKPDEYRRILDILGRDPTLVELGIFSVMWSEHCSYKSSKLHLAKLPTEAPWVVCGPGENAGVVDIGDGQVAVFKMESHNHPSFIEPYQGAATGVGGILRDVFTMGARPVALLDALRFGDPVHPKTRHLVGGVVAGIAGYGNCVGVPTVGGECTFHPAYNGNILVNVMCVGLAQADRVFYARATGIGNPVVYVGSKTGRDGIHGATMASAEFSDETEAKRPTVQVGDPFTEKLLIEACLELMASDCIVAVQDMGAAGLTSSSFEMAARGGTGIELDLDCVPLREPGMTPYEIMLSESQERMLMVLGVGRESEAMAVFAKWGLDFAVIGHVTDTGRMVIRHHRQIVADLPVAPVSGASPVYDRPAAQPMPQPVLDRSAALQTPDARGVDPRMALLKLLGSPDLCAKRWIWQQYDHMVMGDTAQRPGGDAAVVRVHGTNKGLALTTDCTPRYCEADPYTGGMQAVAEAWRNLVAVGARPLAITNCLNFGNPERPTIMGQLVSCIEGMAAACRTLDFPVVSGNVSLYNETDGRAIQPTPSIGGLGLIDDLDQMTSIAWSEPELVLVLVGDTAAGAGADPSGRAESAVTADPSGGNTWTSDPDVRSSAAQTNWKHVRTRERGAGWLGASLYARVILGREDGAPPPVDLACEQQNGRFVQALIREGRVSAAHDIADGGLAIAVAEMALASNSGVALSIPDDIMDPAGWLFGEDQARYVVAVRADDLLEIERQARDAGVVVRVVGTTGGDALTLGAAVPISLDELRRTNEAWLPRFMDDPR